MNKEQYLKNRAQLMATAETLIAEGKVEEATAKMDEVKNLDNDFEKSKIANANLNALRDNQAVADLSNQTVVVAGANTVATLDNTLSNSDDLYVTAWAKDMMGRPLTADEQTVFTQVNDDFRNAAHTTETSGTLVPTTVAKGIWSRIAEDYPLWNDSGATQIQGNLSYNKEESRNVTADWYDEATETEDTEVQFGTLELTGCELSKSATVSFKMRSMAVEEFIPYIQGVLAEKMGIALSAAVYKGKGKPGQSDTFKAEPEGIKTALTAESNTPQLLTYASLTYADLTTAMGKIYSKYASGLVIYANNATIWNVLANVKFEDGRPAFVPDVTAGGVGRLFGYTVKAESTLDDGEILFANVKAGYKANVNQPITVYVEEHAKQRKVDYVAYAIADGGVMDTKAFVVLSKAPTI